MKRFSRHAPVIVLTSFLIIAFILRCIVVMQHVDMGQDIASYLITMRTVFGQDPMGIGLLRPPLIAFPLELFTLAFGTLNGAKVLGVLVSVVISVPFYLLARRICHPWIAVAVSIMFVFSPAYTDMLGWGYLTMIGILFILLTMHFFLLVLEKPSRRDMILTGLCASLVAGFHQLSFAFLVILMVVLLFALLLFNRGKLLENYKPIGITLALAAIFSIPYVPLYIHLAQMLSIGNAQLLHSGASFMTFLHLLGPWPWFWGITLALAIAGLLLLWHQDRNRTLLLAVMLLFPAALTVLVLPYPFTSLNWRGIFLMYIPVWLLVGVTLSWLWSWKKPLLSGLRCWLPRVTTVALIIALLPIGIVSSQRQLHNTLNWYGYLDDTRWQAVEWLKQNTEPGATIAVYPDLLGWWIRAEAVRSTFDLCDRNNVVDVWEKERALVADRILSRNQGLENGNLRLAMTYPYTNAPGNPVLGVYVGGTYQDVLMFDDCQNYFMEEEGDKISLAGAQNREMNITGGNESMQAATLYSLNGFEVTQTVILNQGEQAATICYHIVCGSVNITNFNVPVLFCQQPSSVSIGVNEHSFEVTQQLMTAYEWVVPVTTIITVDAEGASLKNMESQEQEVESSFEVQNNEATITFHFSVTTPRLEENEPVSHYIVPEILKDYGVDYVAVDLKPLFLQRNHIPLGTEEWLNNCPYYKLVYSQGDVRVYQVNISAL